METTYEVIEVATGEFTPFDDEDEALEAAERWSQEPGRPRLETVAVEDGCRMATVKEYNR